jgi:hypothetical protein
MKHIWHLLLITVLSVGSGRCLAQQSATEKALLESTLLDYLEGGTVGDTVRLNRAFHPSASMKFVRDGKFEDVPIDQYLSRIKVGEKQNRSTRIVSYDISGTAAQARVESQYPTFKFIDYFNLLKFNGRWLIVSKIFFRENKAQ